MKTWYQCEDASNFYALEDMRSFQDEGSCKIENILSNPENERDKVIIPLNHFEIRDGELWLMWSRPCSICNDNPCVCSL